MRRFRREEDGQALILLAAMMMTLLMFVGLAIDAGQLFVARRTMQEAADAAAYAGAVVLYQHKTQGLPANVADAETLALQAARDDATRNGYTDGVDGAIVTVNLPPATGPFATVTNRRLYVEVIIQHDVRTALVPAQSLLNTVRVRGVAGAEPLNNQYAIMALDRGDVDDALNIESGGRVDLTGGGILVNSTSTSPYAADRQPGSTITYTCVAPAVCETNVAGGVNGSFPNLTSPAPQEPDPLATYPKPALPACATPPETSCIYNARPITVAEPGVYTISLRASGNTTLVLKPGIYILKAGIDLGGNSAIVSADATTSPVCLADCGVFLFNTTMNYPSPGGTCGPISLAGNADTGASGLKALTQKILPDPPANPRNQYLNFLLYQDPACTATMTITGNAVFSGTGTIYLPAAAFVFDGENATLTGSQLVANTVNIQNGNISINFQAGNTIQPILPRLAE